MTDGKTLADVVAPFGRLPAGAVILVADAVLESVARAHEAGTVKLDLQPANIAFGQEATLSLAPPATAPYWMLPPERARGEEATAAGDLFIAGALFLELLTGQRPLDAGTVEATGQRLLTMLAPLPVYTLCPTIPGFFEHLLSTLLHPDPARRPPDAYAAKALLTDAVEELGEKFPNTLDKLARDPSVICPKLHQHQAEAEARRGAELASVPEHRRAALVSLLRAHALIPGQPQVSEMLAKAAQAGLLRGERPAGDFDERALDEVLAALAAEEPSPNPALLRRAAGLRESAGDLLEAVGLMKRFLAVEQGDKILPKKLDELAGPAGPEHRWATGGTWVLEGASPAESASSAAFPAAGAASSAPDPSPGLSSLGGPTAARPPSLLGGLIRTLSEAYSQLEARTRLFVLVLGFGFLSTVITVAATSWGMSQAADHRAAMEWLAQEAADCPTGGRMVLLQAYQAARLGDASAAEELISEAEHLVPGGTRCQRYGMGLIGKAHAKAREMR